jgi:hypothetical protein
VDRVLKKLFGIESELFGILRSTWGGYLLGNVRFKDREGYFRIALKFILGSQVVK